MSAVGIAARSGLCIVARPADAGSPGWPPEAERPDGGGVSVAGRELTALSRRALRESRQGIGMIFQQFNRLQNASVFDNVAFPPRIHGRHSATQVAARVDACLGLVAIADKRHAFPAQLSGGQKQRVAIARALAAEPAVLLCDEPTSAPDAETTDELLDTLRNIHAQLGVTIVMVTHELSVVNALYRHVALVEDGQIVERFVVADAARDARTRLGRELVRLQAHSMEHAMRSPTSDLEVAGV